MKKVRLIDWGDFVASKRFEKGSEEWLLFMDFWKICQEFWQPEENDEYWEKVIETTSEFHKKYKTNNDIFARKIALAFVDTIEEKAKQARKNSKP